MRRIIGSLLVTLLLIGATLSASSEPRGGHGVWPVEGPTGREFTELAHNWDNGHRGLDIRSTPGTPVRSALPGVVSFVGSIAGRSIVTVTHGDLRTTYEPVAASAAVGDEVGLGGVIGTVTDEPPQCQNRGFLHWGLKRGDTYLNPRLLLSPRRARLVPWDWQAPSSTASSPVDGDWRRPPGQVTSQFGFRMDPVTGLPSLHSGTDFDHVCGQPITAVGEGVVTAAGWSDLGYGNVVDVDHGLHAGRRVVTRYGHAQSISAQVGQRVSAGSTLAATGSTGHSTGCHLHLEVMLDGVPVDPLTWLPQARG